jgi:hypothetical protein
LAIFCFYDLNDTGQIAMRTLRAIVGIFLIVPCAALAGDAASDATATKTGATALGLPAGVTRPADPLAASAFDALQKHCARCHQEGMLSSRSTAAGKFANVLKLDELARAAERVIPGSPEGSRLVQRIAHQEMPYDLYVEFDGSKPEISKDDIASISTWIKSLGGSADAVCSNRRFVTNDDLVDLIEGHLSRLDRSRALLTRYVVLSNLYNACVDDDTMLVYRQAVIKALNSTSRAKTTLPLSTLGDSGVVIPFNLADLGWGTDDWDEIVSVYPYAFRPSGRTGAQIELLARTPLPYVRGDWFAFAAMRPGLYNRLLRLPDTFEQLQEALGVNVRTNIEQLVARRAGFQSSGVSQNNRIIERHPLPSGYFWTTYDFDENRNEQDVFAFPLGPGGNKGFIHKGGETLFSLANGFHGYYMHDARGQRVDRAPTDIMRDISRKDLAVTKAISCIGCHDIGVRRAEDEIRQSVRDDPFFAQSEKERVYALYPPRTEFDQVLERDIQSFARAMRGAGLDPKLKVHGIEMINALSDRYEASVGLQAAAAEFGLTLGDLSRLFQRGSNRRLFSLKRRLELSLVPRDAFESAFLSIAGDIDPGGTVVPARHALLDAKSRILDSPPGCASAPEVALTPSVRELSLTARTLRDALRTEALKGDAQSQLQGRVYFLLNGLSDLLGQQPDVDAADISEYAAGLASLSEAIRQEDKGCRDSKLQWAYDILVNGLSDGTIGSYGRPFIFRVVLSKDPSGQAHIFRIQVSGLNLHTNTPRLDLHQVGGRITQVDVTPTLVSYRLVASQFVPTRFDRYGVGGSLSIRNFGGWLVPYRLSEYPFFIPVLTER